MEQSGSANATKGESGMKMNEKRKQKMSKACNINNDIRSSRDCVEYLRTSLCFALYNMGEWMSSWIAKDRRNLRNNAWHGNIFTMNHIRLHFRSLSLSFSLCVQHTAATSPRRCASRTFSRILLTRNLLFANNDVHFIHTLKPQNYHRNLIRLKGLQSALKIVSFNYYLVKILFVLVLNLNQAFCTMKIYFMCTSVCWRDEHIKSRNKTLKWAQFTRLNSYNTF